MTNPSLKDRMTRFADQPSAQLAVSLAIAGCIAILIVKLLRALSDPWIAMDDAYMFSRYAQNLVQHGSFAWNAEDGPCYGCTSITYGLLVALAHWALPGFSPTSILVLTSGVAGIVAVLLTGVAVAAAMKRHQLISGAAVITYLTALIVAWRPVRFHHFTSGMDTTTAMAANAALALTTLLLIQQPTRQYLALALGAGAIAWETRPDSLLLVFLAPTLGLALHSGAVTKRVLQYSISITVLWGLSACLSYWYFGSMLPLSHSVKQAGFYGTYLGAWRWNPVVYALKFLLASAPALLILILRATRAHIRQLVPFLLPLCLTLAYLSQAEQIMGNHFRFFYPFLPILMVSAACTVGSASPMEPQPGPRIRGWLAAIMIGMILFLNSPRVVERIDVLTRKPTPVVRDDTAARQQIEANSAMGVWHDRTEIIRVLSLLPRGTLVAASEHGRLAAEAPHLRILDIIGLHEPTVAEHGPSVKFIVETHPDVIWFPHQDYPLLWNGLIRDKTISADYLVRPWALNYGVAILRAKLPAFRAFGLALEESEARESPQPTGAPARPLEGSH